MTKTKTIFCCIIIFSILSFFSFAQEDLDTAITSLANKISKHMTEKNKTKIAVIPFQELKSDTVTTLGKYIAEELTTALFNSGKFNIIERNLLNKVLEELKLSQTGAVDPSSAKELGKITGVDAVVSGTIQDLMTRVAINCRLIETETGNIFAAASEKIKKDENIANLLSETVYAERKKQKVSDQEKQKEIEGVTKYEDKKFIVKNYGNLLYEVKLASIRIYENRNVECLLIFKNLSDRDINVHVHLNEEHRSISRNGSTYLADDQGNRYPCISSEGFSNNQMITSAQIPVGITANLKLTFQAINEDINKINLVSFQSCSRGMRFFSEFQGNITIRDIELK